MLVNKLEETRIETIGINIFITKEEAMTLMYILQKYNLEFMNCKKGQVTPNMIQAQFMATDLVREISNKLMTKKED